MSDALCYDDELRRVNEELQAADRLFKFMLRARHEALEKLSRTNDEITEIAELLDVCSAQLKDRNRSKTRRRELRRELKCHSAKDAELVMNLTGNSFIVGH